MTKYSVEQLKSDKAPPVPGTNCCLHKNIVPLEIGFATKTYPNGYKNDPNYNFAINIINANVMRIRSYLCLDCKQEIKAPNPGELKKDRI
jgi:hypothetical protein